ncbi:nuclear transport factor 2 family protein [Rheinheimera sp.]|uniref:nuclear transport factor 2 family protein n=1 Tax=Rheinheimera sp. TaxID=1869214 RepID=UPI00307DC2EE
MISLNPTIANYWQAFSRHDTEALLSCFDPEAVLLYQNQIWVGCADIQRWQLQHPLELQLIAAAEQAGQTLVQAKAGQQLWRYVFALQDGKISRLIIEAGATA